MQSGVASLDPKDDISMADKVIGRGTDHAGANPGDLPSLDAEKSKTISESKEEDVAESKEEAGEAKAEEQAPPTQQSLGELSPDVAQAVKDSVEDMKQDHEESGGADKPEARVLDLQEDGSVTSTDADVENLSAETKAKVSEAVENVKDKHEESGGEAFLPTVV